MTMAIVLDSCVLGMIINSKASPETQACYEWFESLWKEGVQFFIPEIADYEVRRELLRRDATNALDRLDGLDSQVEYVAITTEAIRKAAEFWAQARRLGRPTAAPEALDGDVILAAQTMLVADSAHTVVVATTNVKHLQLFVDARHWRSMQ